MKILIAGSHGMIGSAVTPHLVERDASRQPAMPAPRIHYFDWLRALAVLGVVAYHTLMPFARSTWLIPNAVQSETLSAALLVFENFGLAVLFVVAGASVRFALQRKSMRAFLAERALRLLVPFAVGAVTVVPLIYYVIGLHLGTLSGPFLAFLAAYPRIVWVNNIAPAGLTPEILSYIGMHLWFLAWLFICSALALPIFAFFSSARGRTWVDTLARLARRRGAMFLFAVPITLPRLGLSGLSLAEQGWSLEAFAWYATVFVVGYLIYCDDRLVAAARRDLVPALIVAVVGEVALLAAGFAQGFAPPQPYSATYYWMFSLVGVTGWAWTLTVVGVGMRAEFMQRSLPAFAGEVALPAYVLHFPIVIAISALVVEWPLGFGAKILINALLGVGVTLLVSAIVIRIPALRPLLGLRRPRPSIPRASWASNPPLVP